MSKVKFIITEKDGTKKEEEIEMSQQQQDSLIHFLDDHYKKARVDDLR